MRELFTLDTTLTDPIITPGISFKADTIIMQNPTRYSLTVRVGSKSRPRSVTDATFVCPPGSMLVLPVSASEYAILATDPSLAAAPSGMPTIATITFTRDEKPPAFGVIPLTGLPAPTAVMLRNQGDRAAGSYTDVIQLPSNIRSVAFLLIGPFCSGLSVTDPTGLEIYFRYVAGNMADFIHDSSGIQATFPVDATISPTLNVSYTATQSSANGYMLLGYEQSVPLVITQSDGRQMVDVIPPAMKALPVDADTFGLGAPGNSYSGSIAPPAGAALATTGALAAGTYRLLYVLTTNAPALAGQALYVQRYNAAGVAQAVMIAAPPPVQLSGELYITVAVNESVRASPAAAGAAGTVWAAHLSWVKVA